MHYRKLLEGVNAYYCERITKIDEFPKELYDEETDYFEALDTQKSFSERVRIIVNKWGKCRVHIDDKKLQQVLTVFQQDHRSAVSWEITTTSLWENHEDIIKIFSMFVEVVKYTGASKTLHILNPKFFMMWDEDIRDRWGCSGNGEGYFNFLSRSQREIQEVLQTYTKEQDTTEEISQRIYTGRKKTIVKLLDEYNWAKWQEWI